MAAGLLKLVFAQQEFATALERMGAPLPQVTAIGVPLLETVGGLSIFFNRWPRPFAALLAVNMAAAILLVGLPGLQGRAEKVNGYTVGNEAWRVPLEVAMLAAMIYIAATKHPENSDAGR